MIHTRVFQTDSLCIEFENVVAWKQEGPNSDLKIHTFGTFTFPINKKEDVERFKKDFGNYLMEKHLEINTEVKAEDVL